MGYIIAKAIENPSSCNDFAENDPRLKRSDEKEIHFDSDDTTGTDPDNDAARKAFSKPNNEKDNNHDITDNDSENSNESASNSNILPQKLPLVNNVTKFPANVEKEDIVTDKLTTTKDASLQQPVYYRAIDPKYLIISGLSLPIPAKNITYVSKSENPVNTEIITTSLPYLNLTKATNEVITNDTATDVSNIRELREHLLDHLLDYFLNIIKEEKYIRNDTRKKNGKDRMKVEEKLRNYYDPRHLEMLFDDDDDDDNYYYDNNLDLSDNRRSNDSEEGLLDNVKQNEEDNKESITNIDPLNALASEVDKNTAKAHISPEDLQNEALNLEQNLNSSSNVNLSEPSPVPSKYINLIEKGNNLSIALLNKTKNPEQAFDSNVNIISTTEISISYEALKDKAAEIDTDLLNYSEEAVTDRIEYVYDNSALTVTDYTPYEDYIDSDEFEVVKSVRKNALNIEKLVANDTLNETYNNTENPQVGNAATKSKDIGSEREDKPNKLKILDLPNKNNYSLRNEVSLAQNKNKNSLKNSLPDSYRKLVTRSNKLINKKLNKHSCRKSIILNLDINLI